MRKIGLAFGVTVAIATVQCEGTNTGNPPEPLASFSGSDCQLGQGQSSAAASSAALGSSRSTTAIGTSRQALEADGGSHALDSNLDDFLWLDCIAWNLHDDSTLELDFWNMREGCGAKWVGGSAHYEGNSLHLAAFNQDCKVAKCGLCVYDFHFQVRGAPEGDITVDLDYTDEQEKSCGSEYTTSYVLPTSSERSGTRCDPIYSVGFVTPHCVRHGACGNMVQSMAGETTSCPTCPNGDVCAPIAEGEGNQCLKPCGKDADCENPAMGCRNGGCAIISRWHPANP